MYFNRRNFLRSASILAACSLSEIDVVAAAQQLSTNGNKIAEDDEAYWQNVRQLFPLTKDKIYLNNGTLGPSPYPVIEATREGMMRSDEYGDYSGYEKGIDAIAEFVGADKKEIALTHNVTEGINIACWGLPLHKHDEVIITDQEHVGNALPWLNRHKLHGIELKTFTPAPTAAETLERVAALITRKTRAIAVPHMPCTIGQVLPVKEICTLARDKGIYSCIDGAHGPGMMPIDLHDMGCDTYASCCHKWMLGPKGTGFLYVREGFLDTLQPYFVGGGSSKEEWDLVDTVYMPGYADSAHRYFGGTQSLGLAKGVIAAVGFMNSIGMENVTARIKYLGGYLQERLIALDDKVRLLTPTEPRSFCGINSFRIKGTNYKDFYKKCAAADIRIRAVPEDGMDCLRISTHIYNNKKEIDAFMELLEKTVA
ncbi:MAG: aminotransferase class V-fold PLP-dependent enzyme [Chitinophagaceae bacterium]|nr:aminotransferase class V-fold PLP-dependent enzyme [Chitinophagaceae bacterium]MCB9045575.1 aminotransferase class V-fold PLP-dependent enzyme [Chitinophagales bacterium]